MILNDGAFLFNNQNLFKTLGEVVGEARFQRPRHSNLENSNADFGGNGFRNTHVLKCLHHVEVCLTGGNDAKASVGAIEYDSIQTVNPGELAGGIDFIFVEAELLLQRLVRPSGVNTVEW